MSPGVAPHTAAEKFPAENHQAEALIVSGNLPEAANILVGIVEKDPDNWHAYNTMGILSWAKKKWFDAYALFRKAITICPDYEDAVINFFDASLKLKKVPEALPFLEKALLRNGALHEIAVIRDRIINLGDDIYFSNRALEVGIYSPVIDEAERELEAGNCYKAMELYLKANDTEGPSAAAFCGLGIISYYQKKYHDAYTLFLESIKLNSSDPETFLNLLDAAKECGMTATAQETYLLCRRKHPALDTIADKFEKP
jgi:tetratricopeptide (TPR) repeat protein